ncbi:DUF3306 domain-containing protein [Oceaniglobus roseus]|uniref:DUF3306 domain-containing protein n=1 Tax=Oceaniglobus roseus TaxID=1737570 RepID=UPI000C7EE893|nr:DUF3306 domain-containing protein [Kandeliimicrobium roseum]
MSRPLSFWDRRRAAVEAEEKALAEARQAERAEKAAPPGPAEPETRSDEEILAALDLPDPDTLKMGDDFSRFLGKAVPLHIRNRALRRLWRSNPVLACLDGLNDYDGDYLTGSTGNGPIRTAYQVGKGMLGHLQEVERRAAAAEADAVTPEPDAADPVQDFPEDAEIVQADGKECSGETVAFQTDGGDYEIPAPAPRRMRFTFGSEDT